MSGMDTEAYQNPQSMEDVALELEWVVHEAARKRLAGKPADQEIESIARLTAMQMSIAVGDRDAPDGAAIAA